MSMLNEHEELRKLIEANLEITRENNTLLKKIHNLHVYTMWMRVFWFAIVFGAPFVIYYFIFEPYLKALGINSDKFGVSIKNFSDVLATFFGRFVP